MKFNFFNQLIVRSAAFPYSVDLSEENLFKLWKDPLIREGIFLASKPLYFEIVRFVEKKANDRKGTESLDDNNDTDKSGYIAAYREEKEGVKIDERERDVQSTTENNEKLPTGNVVNEKTTSTQLTSRNENAGNNFIASKKQILTNEKNNDDSKNAASLLQSLYKYVARMSNRSTPFGIFSGVTALEWGAETDVVLSNTFQRRITPDAVLNLRLAKYSQDENPDAQYKINNTVYRQGNEYRFISYTVVVGERFYQLSSLQYNEVLDYLIEDMRDYALTRTQIIALSGYEVEEFLPFLNQLIAIQFLKYAHQPGIGLEFPDYITGSKTTEDTVIRNTATGNNGDRDTINLSQVIAKFANINQVSTPTADFVAHYLDIENDITQLLGFTPVNTFHVTRFNQLQHAVLSTAIQHKLVKAIKLLNNLSNYTPNPRVEKFKRDFSDKYQERSIPLLEVFDTDIGLEYGKWHEKSTFFTEGLEGISFGSEKPRSYTDIELKLLQVATDAYHQREYIFTVPDDFVAERLMDDLPHTMAATFQLFDNGTVYLEQVSGNGGLGMLARFAAGNTTIKDLACQITKEDALGNPDAIYAEIIHMPEERSMNVMAHPRFWSYEIQYIDQANGSHVISLEDLEVLLIRNTFRLFSRKYQREVIPRLSSAYNYNRSQHPIFTFLCDIQHQGSDNGLIFKWGELVKDQTFFPRIVTKSGVILHRAMWKFKMETLQELYAAGKSFEKFKELLQEFRLHWMLPATFLIVKGDNELLIDCENDISLQVLFKDLLKKAAELTLSECLHREWDTVLKDSLLNNYAHQFVAPFSITNLQLIPKLNPLFTQLKRDFVPGSEWLYLKIFLSENTAQPVLLKLYELFENMDQADGQLKPIRKWFFIRYKEGGNHIRLRVELKDSSYFQQVYFEILEVLDPFLTQKLIHTVQLDTYVREIERYSAEKMEFAEELFAADSRFCCQTFSLLKQDYMNKDWLLVFWAVVDYLQRMSPDKIVQLNFAERQLVYFLQEFDDKIVKVQIDQLNRKYRAAIEPLHEQYHELLAMRKVEIDMILNGQEVSWDERFIGSMIHMLLNRYFNTQQRLHECLLYGFIVKALKTDIARSSPRSSRQKDNK